MSPDVPDTSAADELAREWKLFREEVRPIVGDVLAAAEPWDAYREANRVCGVLVDHLTWLPHGGSVYVAWAGLTDLYEVGDTSPEAAHEALIRAASLWFEMPEEPSPRLLTAWLEKTNDWIKKAAQAQTP